VGTTAILLPLGLAAIDDAPACSGIGCDTSAPTIAFIATTSFVIGLLCFGAGTLARKIVIKMKSE
jgi:hypothetical protein